MTSWSLGAAFEGCSLMEANAYGWQTAEQVAAAIAAAGGSAKIGTTTNDDAAAGHIGEYVSSMVPGGTGPALTSGAASNITSISLTAGDWDVSGGPGLFPSGTTNVSFIQMGIYSVYATL
jgi:hypothetical protein